VSRIIRKADAIVVGGGAVGTAAAYQLALRGKKTLLCERSNFASGATGRCGGMVVHCYGRQLNIEKTALRLRFTRANTELMKDYQKTFEIDFELRQMGCLDIAVDEREWEELKELVAVQQSLGDDEIELLDKHETLSVMNNLNPDLIFGSRLRKSDGNLNPFYLARAQALEARKRGAEIFTHTKVDEIMVENGSVVGVRVGDAVFESEFVINATNGWTSLLTAGTEIIPVRELAMVTERLPDLPPQPFEMLCFGDFAYGSTQTRSGNYNLGGPGPARPPHYDYFDQNIYIDEVFRVMSYIGAVFPSLRDVSVIRSWTGTMAFTPDGMPSIGLMPGARGLYIAAGFPDGMAWAAITGKLVAEHICGQPTSLPLDPLDPGRFLGKPKVSWPQPYDLTICHDYLAKAPGHEN
jgi:sarcosine oxidase, subunit beta